MDAIVKFEARVSKAANRFETEKLELIHKKRDGILNARNRAEQSSESRTNSRKRRILDMALSTTEQAEADVRVEAARIRARADHYVVALHQQHTFKHAGTGGTAVDRSLPGRSSDGGAVDCVSSGGADGSSDILKEYAVEVEGVAPDIVVDSSPSCTACNNELVSCSSRGLLVCEQCGLSQVDTGIPTQYAVAGDDLDSPSFSYKRINHFNEWLAQIQAKEKIAVDEATVELVVDSILSHRTESGEAKSIADFPPTHAEIRLALKRLKLRKIYEHTPQVRAKITGILPPQMSPEFEERCRLMFIAIQVPFEKHRPAHRKNFLSYSFVLAKVLELQGCDDYQEMLSLLKGKDKLDKQLQIWELICNDLDWEYIK